MRVIGAALFVLFGFFLGSVVVMTYGPKDPPAWFIALAMSAIFAVVLPSALWLFNAKGSDPFGRLTAEQRIADLEQRGLITDEAFEARRAFGVEESEDEGSSYFIELTDGRVLFLTGQYLYDFESVDDGPPEERCARRFPSTSFVVRRHAKEGHVVDLVCKGEVFDPEVMTLPFSDAEWKRRRVPADGAILTGKSYDAVKAERLAAAARWG